MPQPISFYFDRVNTSWNIFQPKYRPEFIYVSLWHESYLLTQSIYRIHLLHTYIAFYKNLIAGLVRLNEYRHIISPRHFAHHRCFF